MKKMLMFKKQQSGFTLVELMIATAIFSTILVLGLTGFVQIGKTYYKGVTITQTQETAKQIMSEISTNISLASSVSGPNDAGQGRTYYCVGGHRYTFIQYNLVDTSNHNFTNKFGLVEDTLPGTGCGDPFAQGGVPFSNPSELLGNQMRVLQFSISPVQPNLYEVDVTIASGQDSALTSTSDPNAQCKLQLGGNSFCAITKLSTIVYEGI